MTISATIVINSDARRHILGSVLESLRGQTLREFEVVVVLGPTQDGSQQLIEAKFPDVKICFCTERNLSKSRNIGIENSTGEVIAFLDDDAFPEAGWLEGLLLAYDDSDIGAVGGWVYDYTGVAFQYKYGKANILGDASVFEEVEPAHINFPGSFWIPHLLGANSSYRKTALVDAGGYDEFYEYFLDETDVQRVVSSNGWRIRQTSAARVHHKYQPSDIRGESKALVNWYPIVKNKAYFMFKHASFHCGVRVVINTLDKFVSMLEHNKNRDLEIGGISVGQAMLFDQAIDSGLRDGLVAAEPLQEQALVKCNGAKFSSDIKPSRSFASFPFKGAVCLISQEYGEGSGGVSVYITALARELSKSGYDCHIICKAMAGSASVDWDSGVWIHRIVPEDQWSDADLPSTYAAHAKAVHLKVAQLDKRMEFKFVYAPIWDAEAYYLVQDEFLESKTIVAFQTLFTVYLECNDHLTSDIEFMRSIGLPLIRAEKKIAEHNTQKHFISKAIQDSASEHLINLGATSEHIVSHIGIPDVAYSAESNPDIEAPTILFVGRLEFRKGIDVFLKALTLISPKLPSVVVSIVGFDSGDAPRSNSWHEWWEKNLRSKTSSNIKILWLGGVSDLRRDRLLRESTFTVVPSRYESFGLTAVETMRAGRPVVVSNVGGLAEIVTDGVDGVVFESENPRQLSKAMTGLINDLEKSNSMGVAARASYSDRFTVAIMAENLLKGIGLS